MEDVDVLSITGTISVLMMSWGLMPIFNNYGAEPAVAMLLGVAASMAAMAAVMSAALKRIES